LIINDEVLEQSTKQFCTKNSNIPVFMVSSVTGQNLNLLSKFLGTVQNNIIRPVTPISEDFVHFQIEEVYHNVPDVGIVVGGTVIAGNLSEGECVVIGPDIDSNFSFVDIASIHRQRTPVTSIEQGHHATIALLNLEIPPTQIRKGMVLISNSDIHDLPEIKNYSGENFLFQNPPGISNNNNNLHSAPTPANTPANTPDLTNNTISNYPKRQAGQSSPKKENVKNQINQNNQLEKSPEKEKLPKKERNIEGVNVTNTSNGNNNPLAPEPLEKEKEKEKGQVAGFFHKRDFRNYREEFPEIRGFLEFEANVLLLSNSQNGNSGSSGVKVNFQGNIHIGSIRQVVSVVSIESGDELRVGDQSLIRFRFNKYPEYLKTGMKVFLREGSTKLVGHIVRLID